MSRAVVAERIVTLLEQHPEDFEAGYPELRAMLDAYNAADDTDDPPREIVSPRPGGYATALETSNGVTALLYKLLRDYIPAGELEKIVSELEAHGDKIILFSNDFLAAYAKELTLRLQGADPETALGVAHAEIHEAQARDEGEHAIREQMLGDRRPA